MKGTGWVWIRSESCSPAGGIMKSLGFGSALLALGLVFLSLCSTGHALKCYKCDNWSTETCTTETTCAAADNACMKVTLSDGKNRYSCRNYDRCTSALVSEDYGGLRNFEINCCQRNLCNGGVTASPSAVLLLSLAAALLLLLSS